MRCATHRTTNCTYDKCRRERLRRAEDTTVGDLSDPSSALYQGGYGSESYGSADSGTSSCDTSSSSSSSDSSSGSCD